MKVVIDCDAYRAMRIILPDHAVADVIDELVRCAETEDDFKTDLKGAKLSAFLVLHGKSLNVLM